MVCVGANRNGLGRTGLDEYEIRPDLLSKIPIHLRQPRYLHTYWKERVFQRIAQTAALLRSQRTLDRQVKSEYRQRYLSLARKPNAQTRDVLSSACV